MSSRLQPAPRRRTIAGPLTPPAPSPSTTCRHRPLTSRKRPHGGCARSISFAPMKVTAAPPPRNAATTVRACIQVPLVGPTIGIRAVALVQTHQRPSVADGGAFYAESSVAPEIPERLGESAV